MTRTSVPQQQFSITKALLILFLVMVLGSIGAFPLTQYFFPLQVPQHPVRSVASPVITQHPVLQQQKMLHLYPHPKEIVPNDPALKTP